MAKSLNPFSCSPNPKRTNWEKKGKKGEEWATANSLSTNSNFCPDSASIDLQKGIDFKSSDVFLPLEIISNILSRLPVKSLSRFRCVCKLWRSLLTYDSYFISQHYNESLKRPMLIPTYSARRTKVPLYELRPSGDIKHSSVHIKIDNRGCFSLSFSLSNPVSGLVYADGYLQNPFTRDVIQLPKSSRHGSYNYAGLGFDESFVERCKIVRLISETRLSYYACEVLTVGTHEWKYVGDTPCMGPSGHAVFLNGAVHWLVDVSYVPQQIGIFAFDIKYEKFQLVSIPITFIHNAYSEFLSLHELRGHICLVWEHASPATHFHQRFLKIWMLKDYDKNEWEQEYNIDMSDWVNQCQFQSYGPLVIGVQDGKILVQNDGKISSYDFQSKKLCALSLFPDTWTRIYNSCQVITESLVSPRNMLKPSINS